MYYLHQGLLVVFVIHSVVPQTCPVVVVVVVELVVGYLVYLLEARFLYFDLVPAVPITIS
jgi:hypothetical protein